MIIQSQRTLHPFVFEQLNENHVLRHLEKKLFNDPFSNLREFVSNFAANEKKSKQTPNTEQVLCIICFSNNSHNRGHDVIQLRRPGWNVLCYLCGCLRIL